MEGLGGTHWWDVDLNLLTRDMGLSAMRIAVDRVPGNLSQLVAAGVKVVASVWDPTISGARKVAKADGGHLNPTDYGKYADWIVNWIQNSPAQLYAFSPQNEPFFEPSYGGCIWTPQEMRDFLVVLSPKMDRCTRPCKIFWAENMVDRTFENKPFLELACNDPVAKKHADAFAVHGYLSDGFTPGNTNAQLWAFYAKLCKQYNVPLWQTEISGFANSWTGAFELAENIYMALRYGNVSLYTLWALNDGQGAVNEGYAVIAEGRPTSRFYACAVMYRFIRPGAVRIKTVGGENDLWTMAFWHPAENTLTLTFLNEGADKQVKLQGQLPSSFTVWRTSSGENCVQAGTVSPQNDITIKGNAITTLHGTGYTPSVAVSPDPGRFEQRPGFGSGALTVCGSRDAAPWWVLQLNGASVGRGRHSTIVNGLFLDADVLRRRNGQAAVMIMR